MTADEFAERLNARRCGPGLLSGEQPSAAIENLEPRKCRPVPAGWPELPEKALHGLAGEFVRIVDSHSEADPAALLVQFLIAAGNLIGPGPHCLVESSRHGLNLFAVLVGESSKARKGTSWQHIVNLFSRVDSSWASDRVTSGLSSAEGLIAEVQDDSERAKDKRLLVMQSEFSSVLRVMARDGNTLSPTVRAAWDGEMLRTLVKRDPLKASGAHISLIGHITQPELLRYLSDTESHNGFANRLLWCSVRRSKYLPEGGCVPEHEIQILAERLRSVLKRSRDCGLIRRDDTARRFWHAVYPHLSEGQPGLVGAATSRAEAQVLRMSAIYAVLDENATIGAQHLEAALALWDYALDSARYIFGDATGDPVADRIREVLQGTDGGMTRTQISALFKRHVPADRISQSLAQLAALGLAKSETMQTEGRSTEIWFSKTLSSRPSPSLISPNSLNSQLKCHEIR